MNSQALSGSQWSRGPRCDDTSLAHSAKENGRGISWSRQRPSINYATPTKPDDTVSQNQVAPALPKSQSRQALERPVANGYLIGQMKAMQDVSHEERDHVVYNEIEKGMQWKIGAVEDEKIREWVWDRGMKGIRNKELCRSLYFELGLEEDDVVKQHKVLTKVGNVYRVLRDLDHMIVDDDITIVAARLTGILERFTDKPGGKEALENAGVKIWGLRR